LLAIVFPLLLLLSGLSFLQLGYFLVGYGVFQGLQLALGAASTLKQVHQRLCTSRHPVLSVAVKLSWPVVLVSDIFIAELSASVPIQEKELASEGIN